MPSNLNVIALISGGKDSLYSLLHSLRNGDKIVALANLYPPPPANTRSDENVDEDGIEEGDVNSFMYQTIGHQVIPLYEEALGIPLYRGIIRGGAVDGGVVYGSGTAGNGNGNAAEDETESLIPLLQRIKEAHPEANALSAGAILSTYQRTRVENVAARLGLIPVAWLWMYPVLSDPEERKGNGPAAVMGLLEDMAAVGCEARVIKVASGGLDESVLWGDVAESEGGPGGTKMRGRVLRGVRRFAEPKDLRGAVLGEGGEYETLALDGPGFLWKRRIVVDTVEVKRGEGGVGYLRLRGARCVDKEFDDGIGLERVRRPGLLDEAFEGALGELLASGNEDKPGEAGGLGLEDSHWEESGVVETGNGGLRTVSNITASEAGPGAGEQMEGIANKVKTTLASGNRASDDIVFATVLLHSMDDFTTVNDVYSQLFKKPNPPARATVACGNCLPEGVRVMVSIVVDLGPQDQRRGLHVQSRSYWGPANIGPYSQAMSVPIPLNSGQLVYVAGQIPLESASMELASRSPETVQTWFENFSLRAVLSLQHMWRIGVAMNVDWWLGAVAFLTGDCIDTKARVAWSVWKKLHTRPEEMEEDEPVLDAWDIKYGRRGDELPSKPAESNLPNFSVVLSDMTHPIPPFFAVHVEQLPRGSDIEWQGMGCQREIMTVAAGEMDAGRRIDTILDSLIYTGIEIGTDQSGSLLDHLQTIIDAYCRHSKPTSHAVIYTTCALPGGFWPGLIVPCKAIWGQEGRRLTAGVILQKDESDR